MPLQSHLSTLWETVELRELLVVGTGGFVGAIARYWISGQVYRWTGAGFPWGTMGVNTVGCLALGALMAISETRLAISPEARLFIGIGILGSMTTFSTLSFETLELLRRSAYTAALLNTAGSLILGLGAVMAGRLAMRWLAG